MSICDFQKSIRFRNATTRQIQIGIRMQTLWKQTHIN